MAIADQLVEVVVRKVLGVRQEELVQPPDLQIQAVMVEPHQMEVVLTMLVAVEEGVDILAAVEAQEAPMWLLREEEVVVAVLLVVPAQ